MADEPDIANEAVGGSTGPEKEWLRLVQDKTGDTEAMIKLHEENPTLNVDCLDTSGMTALHHAAFRANFDLCRYLLDHGADVNSDKHDNQYTALMFGALSGSEEVVNLLMEAGAIPHAVNSVKRTAGEMASFIAQYHISGTIMNFIPTKDLVRFTERKGQEKRPKLRAELVKPFHALITRYNIHPIYMLKELKKEPELVKDSKYLSDILNLLVLEKMLPHNTHETQALKFHYLSCVFEQAGKAKDGDLDALMKRLATGRASDGYLDQVEQFVRSTLRSFPRADSQLFRTLLEKLNRVEIGENPPGIVALTDTINGLRMRTDEERGCDVCATKKPKKCQGCFRARYCSRECQKLHIKTHKKYCKKDPIFDEK